MASVTVSTAARVDAVEDASVVSAVVDGTGHLILTKGSGSTVDAGLVAGELPEATLIQQGIVELATDAETTAGTDAERAVTPAGLAAALLVALATLRERTNEAITINGGDANGKLEVVTIQDDNTDTNTWVNRVEFKFAEFTGGLIRNTFYLNEYGEIRVSPAKHNTTAFRAFVKEFANNPTTARSATTPVLEMMDNRTDRNSIWAVIGDGTTVIKGINMAYVLVLSAAASVPAGTPAGTVIVRTTT